MIFIFTFIRNFWQKIVGWWRPKDQLLKTVPVEELPDQLIPKSVYIVGQEGNLWYAAMICPCGCKETLHISLYPDGRPRWKLTENADRTISITPSVWRKVGCRSHFYITHSEIVWC
jgi:hypothetical protein